jgi:hypothetical protein
MDTNIILIVLIKSFVLCNFFMYIMVPKRIMSEVKDSIYKTYWLHLVCKTLLCLVRFAAKKTLILHRVAEKKLQIHIASAWQEEIVFPLNVAGALTHRASHSCEVNSINAH